MILRRIHAVWLLPTATFAAAILLDLLACDSNMAFIVASILCAATGILAGGLLFIGHGRAADTFAGLLAAAFLALVVAIPVAGVTWVIAVVVAAVHCGFD